MLRRIGISANQLSCRQGAPEGPFYATALKFAAGDFSCAAHERHHPTSF